MRLCTTCNTEKNYSEFYATHGCCKECSKKRQKERYNKNKQILNMTIAIDKTKNLSDDTNDVNIESNSLKTRETSTQTIECIIIPKDIFPMTYEAYLTEKILKSND